MQDFFFECDGEACTEREANTDAFRTGVHAGRWTWDGIVSEMDCLWVEDGDRLDESLEEGVGLTDLVLLKDLLKG